MRPVQLDIEFNAGSHWWLVTLSALICLLCLSAPSSAVAEASISEEGRTLAFETTKGNCLACHHIPGGRQMGDIGPPLDNMAIRFPSRARLFKQVWDAGAYNLNTLMPPYGRHEILTKQEINMIIDFLYTR